MTPVFELEVWSTPNKISDKDAGYGLQKSFAAIGVNEEILIPLNYFPCETDVTNLLMSLEAKRLRWEDFSRFCIQYGFENDVKNHVSACRFRDFSYGCALAWLHIPADTQMDEVVAKIVAWARKIDHVIVEPHTAYCLI